MIVANASILPQSFKPLEARDKFSASKRLSRSRTFEFPENGETYNSYIRNGFLHKIDTGETPHGLHVPRGLLPHFCTSITQDPNQSQGKKQQNLHGVFQRFPKKSSHLWRHLFLLNQHSIRQSALS
jgi:hypothetical protein